MLLIEDLELDAEIVPLFNYTYHADAEAALRRLLHELPATAQLITDKQAVIQGFIANWSLLAGFSYQKIHFQEVRTFLLGVSRGHVTLETSQVRLTAKLLFSETERYGTRARYTQVVLFLQRLQQHYVADLDLTAFPTSYRARLTKLQHFFERFALTDTSRAIQEDSFGAKQMSRLAQQLRAVTAEEMEAFWAEFYEFEAYWSVAKGCQERGFAFPRFQEDGLCCEEFYHPSLQHPVKNTLLLDETAPVAILTGPNMSGKSTLLKALGLCVYLAHAGLAVPATACSLPFFQSIVVAINLRDSLRDGYSHFIAEIQNLKQVVLAASGPGRVFAIFDELFRGTNVDDALEITRTTIQGLAGFPQSYFLVSTHLLHLEHALGGQPGLAAYCIECTLEDSRPVFSYRLQPGWSRLRIGRLLFQEAGMNSLLANRKPKPL